MGPFEVVEYYTVTEVGHFSRASKQIIFFGYRLVDWADIRSFWSQLDSIQFKFQVKSFSIWIDFWLVYWACLVEKKQVWVGKNIRYASGNFYFDQFWVNCVGCWVEYGSGGLIRVSNFGLILSHSNYH